MDNPDIQVIWAQNKQRSKKTKQKTKQNKNNYKTKQIKTRT
jgi:hypothetical protein